MTRKELAHQVFLLIRRQSIKNSTEIWRAIAETDDSSLLSEYEKLTNKYYTKEEE